MKPVRIIKVISHRETIDRTPCERKVEGDFIPNMILM
jgi:hypothetical protein